MTTWVADIENKSNSLEDIRVMVIHASLEEVVLEPMVEVEDGPLCTTCDTDTCKGLREVAHAFRWPLEQFKPLSHFLPPNEKKAGLEFTRVPSLRFTSLFQ